jgi:ParB/RepB/Spo0J family partition protein
MKEAKLMAVPVGKVIPCPWNPRNIDADSVKIRELAESMKARGQIQPGVGRPGKGDTIELLAGRRRFEAVKQAGIPTLLLIVSDLDDHAAKDVTVLENMQRDDLTPLEEAAGVQTLLDDGRSPAEVASKMGKTPQWIIRRAQLTKLIPDIVKKIESGLLWNIGHMEMIARLSAEQQAEIAKLGDYAYQSGSNLPRYVSSMTMRLKSAVWSPGDATLSPKAGSCENCPKRSSHQPGLFDDEMDAEKIRADDTCLDSSCFHAKSLAHANRQIAELGNAGKKVVRISGNYTPDDKTLVGNDEWDECRKGTPGAVLAFVMESNNKFDIGKQMYVTLRKNGRAAAKQKVGGKDDKKAEPSLKDRMAVLLLRRQAHALEAVSNAVANAKNPCDKWNTMERLFRLVCIFGCERDWQSPLRSFGENADSILKSDKTAADKFNVLLSAPKNDNNKHPFQFVWSGVKQALSCRVKIESQHQINAERIAWAEACCEVIGHTWQEYLAAAEKAIPMSKALAAQAEQAQVFVALHESAKKIFSKPKKEKAKKSTARKP